jgi:hypothetical protein
VSITQLSFGINGFGVECVHSAISNENLFGTMVFLMNPFDSATENYSSAPSIWFRL